jgi:transposase
MARGKAAVTPSEDPHAAVRYHALVASYDTLRRYAMEELGWQKKEPTILLEDPPAGQEAQIDFGKMGMMLDAESGRMRALWVLIVTLSLSRYQFVWPTFLQTTDAVCEGLDRAWWFFGAMARTILPDNMSSVIKIADALNPSFVAPFLDYTQARGICVDPARVRSPKDKPRVENQVAYVRESWWDGETFTDLTDTQRSAAHWSREIAAMRVHGTTRKVPREVFEALEKPAMLPAAAETFDVPRWARQDCGVLTSTPRYIPITTWRSPARSTRHRRCTEMSPCACAPTRRR